MKITKNVHSAWENDSFYIQTISTNEAYILRAGAVGFLISRITGIGIPKDQAIYSTIYKIVEVFLEFIGKKL